MQINLIYRKRNTAFFSIEKVFGLVTNRIQHSTDKTIKLEKRELPFRSSNVFLLILNVLFLLPKRKGIFHITGDIHYVISVLPKTRTVLTIHDLVFLHTHKGLTKWFLKWTYLILPVRKAKFITTISEKSKNEIIYFTKCDPDKIRVIPNPVDFNLTYQKKEFNHIKPRILFLGTKANKNLELSLLSLFDLPIHLRIIGELSQLQKETLLKFKIEFSSCANLSEEDIHQEFIDCDIVLFPSTYEGFGLPVIEAFKAGRAVITSDLEPMKVISSGAALLVNPYEIASIRKGVIEVINNPVLRNEMVEKGFEIVKGYEVDKIAEQYFNLWSKIANEK